MSATGARPLVLVLAGHDPTGGAGVDADRGAIERAGGEARCVVTNRTQQDGRRVFAVEPVALERWTTEADALLTAGGVAAVKTGLLSSAAQVDAVADLVRARRATHGDLPCVVDPVLAASGGEVFLDAAGRARLLERLGDLGAVLTPNVPELGALTGSDGDALASEPQRRIDAARALVERGATAVVVKGGHGHEDPVVDLWVDGEGVARAARPRAIGRSIHGSGCRFAAFLATRLAVGDAPAAALGASGDHLAALIAASPPG